MLIANFWLTHHRLFAGIHRVTNGLLWLTIAWMFTIVWLPIPTALLGQLETDAGQEVLYIGTLALTSLVMFLSRLYVLRIRTSTTSPRRACAAGWRRIW